MSRYRRRPRAGSPRVDDLFYGNPTPPTQDSTTAGETRVESGDSASDPAEESEQVRPAPPSRRRQRVGAAGRWGRALLIAAVGAGLVYAAGAGAVGTVDLASLLNRPEPGTSAATQQSGVAVVSDRSLACPGPGLVGLENPEVEEPPQLVRAYAGSAPGGALPEGLDVAESGEVGLSGTQDGETAVGTDRGHPVSIALAEGRWARAQASGGLAAGFAASQLSYSFAEQQWGLSTAVCGSAAEEAWLLAGGGQPGRTERLILINPTGNPVTVTAEVFGASGPVGAAGGSDIVVPAGGRQVVLVDALAPGEEHPVLHISSSGGPVVASLADRWLEGTLDRGNEHTTPTAAPDTELLIPAVPSPRPKTADSATVRVAVPGTETTVVQLRALTADGPVRLEQGVSTIEAQSVVDLDVSDLPAGTQAIEVSADLPVVAAAQVERRDRAEGIGDLGWIPAVAPSSELVGAPLGDRGATPLVRVLSIASLTGAHVEVITVTDGTVESRELEVPAAANRTVKLTGRTDSAWVRPIEGAVSTAVVSTIGHQSGTQVAGLPLPPTPLTHEIRAITPWRP